MMCGALTRTEIDVKRTLAGNMRSLKKRYKCTREKAVVSNAEDSWRKDALDLKNRNVLSIRRLTNFRCFLLSFYAFCFAIDAL